MTNSQRAALLGMVDAILACSCASPDIRFRAQNLRARLRHDYSPTGFSDCFG